MEALGPILLFLLIILLCVGLGIGMSQLIVGNKNSDGIKVIKKGKIPEAQIECQFCHSIVEYKKNKVLYTFLSGDRPYIICPVCNKDIYIEEKKEVKYD